MAVAEISNIPHMLIIVGSVQCADASFPLHYLYSHNLETDRQKNMLLQVTVTAKKASPYRVQRGHGII